MKYQEVLKKNSMIYPNTMIKGSTIGITAVSAGLGYRIEDLESSLNNLSKYYNFIETKSVRNKGFVSNGAKERAKELDSLFVNKKIDGIFCATGGDFCLEMLDYINFDNIVNNPKWIMGASDPTSILYTLTTKYNIATIYGMNATSYSGELHECHLKNLEILQGNIVKQDSYLKYDTTEGFGDYQLNGDVYWESNQDIDVSGRLIGGCFDVLLNMIGTKYDNTLNFIEKYKDDGIIWYFDNFAKNSVDFYLGLLQMKMVGWFKYTKCIMIGRVKYPSNPIEEFDYKDALKRLNLNIPIINNCDIGHVFPKMTIINGSIGHVKCSDGCGSIEMELR